ARAQRHGGRRSAPSLAAPPVRGPAAGAAGSTSVADPARDVLRREHRSDPEAAPPPDRRTHRRSARPAGVSYGGPMPGLSSPRPPRHARRLARRRRGDLARAAGHLAIAALIACHGEPARPAPATIRVAVIGGMLETGFWPEVVARYELVSGNHVELVASGPKQV